MRLFEKLFGFDKEEDKEEEKLKNYGLSEEERKNVKKSRYDVWNFEEEELEDDDYYSEDDE